MTTTRSSRRTVTEDGNSNQMAEQTPVPRGNEAQPERTPNAQLTLDERIQEAIARRDELTKARTLQALEAEIARLERETSPVASTIEAPEVTLLSSRKRGAGSPTSNSRVKRTLRPKDPAEYRGKSLREHREFVRSCETAFCLVPQDFYNDRDKVLWSMQYLKGDIRDLWYTHYERTYSALESPTWSYFKNYLLDLLSDPVNRSLEAAMSHAAAEQRKDQTVRAFAGYLEILEDQLPPYTEEQRVQHLFSKLRPEIQRAITNYHQIPATREDLVALGSTLERNLRAAFMTQPPRSQNTRKTLGRETQHRGQTPKPQNKQNDTSEITCYNCNKKGHYATKCLEPKTNPNRMPVRINQTGKGRASSLARGQ